jgi:hypothetical protein
LLAPPVEEPEELDEAELDEPDEFDDDVLGALLLVEAAAVLAPEPDSLDELEPDLPDELDLSAARESVR